MPSQELFKNENTLFDDSYEGRLAEKGPVTCLGMKFENDDERRQHFTEKLREKLKDPEFRKIEGFPLGNDEDILNLSDPPYYTACPNPWIADFVKEWEEQKPEKPDGHHYHREPFATDVSEGKNDPIYNAHSYHTKVPHKAIMRYILHYTEPGDIVFDGFCGTGMTGVAAQMCGDRNAVMALGYQVKEDGLVLKEEINEDGKKSWEPFSKLGARQTLLSDLSTAATFIAYNFNAPINVKNFEIAAKKIIKDFESETSWMWQTLHSDGETIGKINYTVWSEVYSCPECLHEIIYYTEAFKKNNTGDVEYNEEFNCPSCGSLCAKRPSKKSLAHKLERKFETVFDEKLKTTLRRQKRLPAFYHWEY